MRESRKGEKTHLPRGSTEVWLVAQRAVSIEVKHRNPPKDSYETWVSRQAKASRGRGTRKS